MGFIKRAKVKKQKSKGNRLCGLEMKMKMKMGTRETDYVFDLGF